MKPSTDQEVRAMYDDSAESYSTMMDSEISLPLYGEQLGRLNEQIKGVEGALIDTSCGSGHMLDLYRKRFDPRRPLVGIDLSPQMVEISSARLGQDAQIEVGDMRRLDFVETDSAAAVISFFALHHLDSDGAETALREWRRVIAPGGRLVLATWEGSGAIDYGGQSDIVALRFTDTEVSGWAESAGFIVSRCVVEPVEGMEMDAVYLEASAG